MKHGEQQTIGFVGLSTFALLAVSYFYPLPLIVILAPALLVGTFYGVIFLVVLFFYLIRD